MVVALDNRETLEAFKTIEQLGEDLAETRPDAAKTVGQFFERLGMGVPKSTAARFLAVTDETVSSWLRRGVLKPAHVPGSPKVFVDLRSLLQTEIQVEDLRKKGAQRNLSMHLLNRIDGRGFEGRPEVARAIRNGMDEVKKGVRGIVLDGAWFEKNRPA